MQIRQEINDFMRNIFIFEHEDIFKYVLRDNGKRRNDYLDILNKSEVVISFAQHETWGNSMIEGIMIYKLEQKIPLKLVKS